ncbi:MULTISPECIES: DotI/IcmL/TraM family protein [Aeromonas]|uniref:Uncharacterized protein n=1 Tax=Aeromonas veronii TaxID=654 RepID=A0A4S5CGV2_AERVE|nr:MULTISPECIES: DotI/IcmL/TraM family protein [Aeromonas]THJ43673.1 hypothetical protein E8Q35_15315 [Aeromonas veronii]
MFGRKKGAQRSGVTGAKVVESEQAILVEPTAEALEARVVRKSNMILSGFLLASMTVNVSMGFGIWLLSSRAPVAGDTYAMDRDGGRVKLLTFEGSGNSTARLLNYTSESAAEILTFNFLNLDARLDLLKDRFTSRGYRQYRNALEQARVKNYLEANQEAWSTAINETPVIANEKGFLDGGAKKWLMQVGVLTTRLPKSKSISYETRKVTMELVQIDGSNFKIDSVGWEKI